jgi:hypothetical protein
MELISAVALGILGLLGAALSKLMADEFKAWLPTVINRLIGWAISSLPEDKRERYAEEWQSHIDETPGKISKLIVGLGLLLAARKLSRIEIKKIGAGIRSLEEIIRDISLLPEDKRREHYADEWQSDETLGEIGKLGLPLAPRRLSISPEPRAREIKKIGAEIRSLEGIIRDIAYFHQVLRNPLMSAMLEDGSARTHQMVIYEIGNARAHEMLRARREMLTRYGGNGFCRGPDRHTDD